MKRETIVRVIRQYLDDDNLVNDIADHLRVMIDQEAEDERIAAGLDDQPENNVWEQTEFVILSWNVDAQAFTVTSGGSGDTAIILSNVEGICHALKLMADRGYELRCNAVNKPGYILSKRVMV